MKYEVYSDQTGHWSEVAKDRYDGWDGEKRIIEIVKTEFGRPRRPEDLTLPEIVSAVTKEFEIAEVGLAHAEVRVPYHLAEQVRNACYRNCPAIWKVDVIGIDAPQTAG